MRKNPLEIIQARFGSALRQVVVPGGFQIHPKRIPFQRRTPSTPVEVCVLPSKGTSEEYGDWRHWLLCCVLAIALSGETVVASIFEKTAAKFRGLSSFRKVFVGLSLITVPAFLSIAFGVQAVNVVVEAANAIRFFTAAAVSATLFFWVWEEITELQANHRRITMAVLGAITVVSLHYGVSWVVEKADDAAWEAMVHNAHDGFMDAMTINIHAELMKKESAESKAIPAVQAKAMTPKPPSFVYVNPGVWIVTGTWDIFVNHRGPDPSYNVEIWFVDLAKKEQVVSKSVSLTKADIDSFQMIRSYPEIDPKGRTSNFAIQFLWTPPVPDHEKYAIEITWRDGSVHQDLQVERVGDKWYWATQVTDKETKRLLVNCKDKGFPFGPPGDEPCFPRMSVPAS